MGGGCNRIEGRESFFVGSFCENNCFDGFGGCDASFEGLVTKTHDTCEMKPESKQKAAVDMEAVINAIRSATRISKSIFLYTPDMFSGFYLENCFQRLPENSDAYISVNACVRTLIDSGISFAEIRAKGIREIWLGVESGDSGLRDKYSKLRFTNEELIQITRTANANGVHVCWYLVDGIEDTIETRMRTYDLVKIANPFRIHIGELRAY